MDRRNFLTTLLAAPTLTPVLLASQRQSADCELYLIADQPQRWFSSILREMGPALSSPGGSFTFSHNHPLGSALGPVLEREGWAPAPKNASPALTISFRTLRSGARPSFSLVRGGRIWDIRSKRLLSLWREMNREPQAATILTVATFRGPASPKRGKEVSLYRDGRRIARLPLDRDDRRTFGNGRGSITIQTADGRAWIAESSCRHQICRYSPPVSLPGERILCAPNRLLLQVNGGDVDTVIG